MLFSIHKQCNLKEVGNYIYNSSIYINMGGTTFSNSKQAQQNNMEPTCHFIKIMTTHVY